MNDPYQTLPPQPIDLGQIAAEPPQRIGRYRIERVLGKGGFGLVYLAQDEQLQRLVAVKVPHSNLVSRPEDAEAYLAEARTVANLDHPNIVPVHDVGSTDNFPCYVVSKYIEGRTLAERIRANRPSVIEAAELVATVAETLQYAHKQGIVHRDIKPGNILLDTLGKPFVADFGLALREQDVGKGSRFAGTPAYMSPEQARGEGHRVDGRSDLYSLGVVLYELLTGRRPFKAATVDELLEQVINSEVRPPRQWDETIPKELERISLKALSKRASDRYTTGKDMADDLRRCFEQTTEDEKAGLRSKISANGIPSPALASTPVPSAPPTPTSDQRPVKIVPKGLRSFDAQDADFFLELLPGPRDRDGLPDGIRFWKARIEERDPDNTFTVGLIYGPSGCGKSSLVKAGLLPRLSKDVIAVYVEAVAEETETRLLNGLRKRCPTLPGNLSLKESLAALRRGQGVPAGKKVLIVLDQFEQWLHAKKEEQNTDLVQALRHCDGGRVQCVVMVRDDFWLAVSRFVRDLEVDLVPDRNIALVDLFDLDHARKMLAAFGCAFGKLPEKSKETSKDQHDFLTQAVSGLSQENKVVSVRLALFAEMMKGKPWTPATLKEVGGTAGIGVTFLEDAFSSPTANPKHRYHQKAARAVLKSLLPDSGTDIKGHMRSYAELLGASGYGSRPKDFDDLIRILDGEIRLITPTDPEGKEEGLTSSLKAGEKYYQLTHDYLVPSLRDWLTRKQKETRRGRAELLLADRAVVWNARQENRQLPSLAQWLRIRWLAAKKQWTPPQRKMMGRATRYHASRLATLGVLLAAATFTGLAIREQVVEQQKATHAAGLVQRVLDAETAQVPGVVAEMSDYRKWVDPLLRQEYDKAAANSRQQLHASLALLPTDSGQVDYLYGRLLDSAPNEVPVIRDALDSHKDEMLDKLWSVAETPEKGKESQRLRAASALAKYDQESERWDKTGALVVNDLVLENPVYLGQWTDAFRPVKNRILPLLFEIFHNRQPERAAERSLAANLLAEYNADQPQVLADLLMDADEKQFAAIYPKFRDQGDPGLSELAGELEKQPVPALNWTVRFYQWEPAGPMKPPADWEAVLRSRVMDELQTTSLGFHWTKGLPTKHILNDYFAVVAITEASMPESEYLLSITFDDGIRVWLDDKVVFENWGYNVPTTKEALIKNKPGKHTLKVEYFQIDGGFALDVGLRISDEAKEQLLKRQANAAVALLKMNHAGKVWPLLQHSPDPTVRSSLIHRLAPLGTDAGIILKRLDEEPDVTIRRALLLSLVEYDEHGISQDARKAVLPKLQDIYRNDADPGLHAACESLLRQWKQEAWLNQINDEWTKDQRQRAKRLDGIKELLTTGKEKMPQWYVNGQEQTMVVIPGPMEFLMGSPLTEAGRFANETQHKVRIGRTFALAAKSVTLEQYRKFDDSYKLPAVYTRTADLPVVGTSWHQAAAYCNWLSKEEGINKEQWCYEINDSQVTKLKANYLSLTGYRLPTEAEMEFATRAGALTSRYYGETEGLLPKYAWYTKNSQEKTWPVGSLKPNDLGLFDVQGNVFTWCQERYKDYPAGKGEDPEDDKEDMLSINNQDSRVLRGGMFDNRALFVRSANRNGHVPSNRINFIGFRPARTFTP